MDGDAIAVAAFLDDLDLSVVAAVSFDLDSECAFRFFVWKDGVFMVEVDRMLKYSSVYEYFSWDW